MYVKEAAENTQNFGRGQLILQPSLRGCTAELNPWPITQRSSHYGALHEASRGNLFSAACTHADGCL